jgi:hypothetical protein
VEAVFHQHEQSRAAAEGVEEIESLRAEGGLHHRTHSAFVPNGKMERAGTLRIGL